MLLLVQPRLAHMQLFAVVLSLLLPASISLLANKT